MRKRCRWAALLLSVLLLSGCAQKAERKVPELLEPAAVQTNTTTAYIGEIYQSTFYNASIKPYVESLSFKVSGEVMAVHGYPGQLVEEGDVLIELNKTDLQERCDQLQQEISYTQQDGEYADEIAELDIQIFETELKQLKKQEKALKEKTAALKKDEAALKEQQAALSEQETSLTEKVTALKEEEATLEEKVTALKEQTAALQEESPAESEALPEESAAAEEESEAVPEENEREQAEKELLQTETELAKVKADRIQAEADLEKVKADSAKAAEELAKAEEERKQTEEQLPQAEKDIALKENEIEQSKARLKQDRELRALELKNKRNEVEELKTAIRDNELRAPFSGRIIYGDLLTNGSWVQAEDPVVFLADDSKLTLLSAYVGEDLIEKADRVYAEINNKEYEVEYVPMDPDEYVSMVLAGEEVMTEFELLGTEEELAAIEAGQSVTIYLWNDYVRDALLVPSHVIMKDENGGIYVYVDENGTRVKRMVKTGTATNSRTQILEGLKEGEVIYVQD